MLPQNIQPVGERVEENKNIYISQAVYKDIHRFTQNKTTNESGGILVGSVIEEFGKSNIVIAGFIEAKYCEGTPTTLTFTHETWEYVHKEIEKKHKGQKIVGWIHTHPDFGIFLSEYDKFIHKNFFSEEHQVAYVVDPIQNVEGFYFWINGNIERCKGFYIYEKTGTKISVDIEKNEPIKPMPKVGLIAKNVVAAILIAAVFALIFSNISLNNQMERLENQQQALMDSANQSLSYMQQQIGLLAAEIQALQKRIEELESKAEAEIPLVTDADNETDAASQEDSAATATDAPIGLIPTPSPDIEAETASPAESEEQP
ncbi:MAG: Mov34/MPN/PAD-1 family protein [Clostridia bacterium]|nr:Mov34/MPN/PAD-1 family protein [Clostridia bacterium]